MSTKSTFICLTFLLSIFIKSISSLSQSDVTESTSSSGKFVGVWLNAGDNTVTATDARSYCQLYYYDLATVLSDLENTEVVSAVESAGLTANQDIWIGYTDSSDFVSSAVEGTFLWMDGSSSDYTNWASGEPNDVSNEDCTVIFTGWSNQWNDLSCTTGRNAFVCLSQATPILSREYVSSSSSSSNKFIGVVPNSGVTAYVAREFCQYYYYDLATLQSDSQGDEIITTVRTAGGFDDTYNFDVWIGFTDDENNNFDGVSTTEGTFIWIDGSTNTYSNWYTDEPNNFGGDEDCTVIVTAWGNQWNDAICTATPVAFACETALATNSPTAQSTNEPTSNPTKLPTKTPTKTPTNSPTFSPTTLNAGWNIYPSLNLNPGPNVGELISSFDSVSTADDCFNAAKELYPDVNYIQWRENKNRCRGYDISDRDDDDIGFISKSSTTSFIFLEATLTYSQVTEATSSSGKFTGVWLNAGDNTVTAVMAREYCEAHYYDLATILSLDEHNEAITAAQDAGLTGSQDIWIGYTDSEYFGATTEGTFIWMDGDDSTYTNWASGEPNDVSGEDCTVIYTGWDAWNDLNCGTGRNAFVCLNQQNTQIQQIAQSNWDFLNQYIDFNDKTYGVICLLIVLIIFGIIIGLIRKFCYTSDNDYKNIDYQRIDNNNNNNAYGSRSRQRYDYQTIDM